MATKRHELDASDCPPSKLMKKASPITIKIPQTKIETEIETEIGTEIGTETGTETKKNIKINEVKTPTYGETLTPIPKEEIYKTELARSIACSVYQVGGTVTKRIHRNAMGKATFNFHNEIKMLTHLSEKGYDISPKLYSTETLTINYIINMEYCGLDLYEIYSKCTSYDVYMDPLTKTVHKLDMNWWTQNIKNICQQIKNIVTILQNENILHLDIKPENFVMDLETKKIKIIDFSSSVFTTDKHEQHKLRSYCLGTRCFMSPEAVFDGDRSFESDAWATAVTLFGIQAGTYLPGTVDAIMEMNFTPAGYVMNREMCERAYTKLLDNIEEYITNEYSFNPEILKLTKYFVEKERRPIKFD